MLRFTFLHKECFVAINPWKASVEVVDLLEQIKEKHHHERLMDKFDASIAVSFDDSKPFLRNKLNLGKVTKFSPLAKLWQGEKHDFCLSISMDLWHSVLKGSQREAYIDLLLTRCTVEFLPEEIEENGKKKKVKDEWGRVQYTQEIKVDDNGNPKWKVAPLDLEIFASNVRRYGLWCDDLMELKEAISAAPEEVSDSSPDDHPSKIGG